MRLKITDARPATSDEWDNIWANCDYATYFHSREWSEVWQKYTYGKLAPAARLITFSDNKSALLTLSTLSTLSTQWLWNGLVTQYVLSPGGTFGGWLSVNELSNNHSSLLYEYISTHFKNLTWRLNPYNPLEANLKINDIENDQTHTLNLRNGFESIYKGWTKGHASGSRKAQKAGVEIREAATLKDWEDYYETYEDSLQRWGESASTSYEWRFFQHIYDLSSSNIKLWLAIYENQVVAGALCLYAKTHVCYWHGSALEKYFNLRPVNLLMYEAIKDSCTHGYQWFDFNPSGGHQGVKAFKRSFGAEELSCPIIKRNTKTIRLARRVLSLAR